MSLGHYILDENGQPKETDTITWARFFGDIRNRRVAETRLRNGTRVSTIFLGLDHSFGDGPPVLWETMIFGGKHDQWMARYRSRAEAEDGHADAVNLAREEPVRFWPRIKRNIQMFRMRRWMHKFEKREEKSNAAVAKNRNRN